MWLCHLHFHWSDKWWVNNRRWPITDSRVDNTLPLWRKTNKCSMVMIKSSMYSVLKVCWSRDIGSLFLLCTPKHGASEIGKEVSTLICTQKFCQTWSNVGKKSWSVAPKNLEYFFLTTPLNEPILQVHKWAQPVMVSKCISRWSSTILKFFRLPTSH